MRQAALRAEILEALKGGAATSSALKGKIAGALDLHDEIWGGALRGLITDGMVVKELGNYRLTGQQKPTSNPAEAAKDKIGRSASGLREALFDAIDGLRSGAIDVKQANAIATAAGTILKSIDTQVAFERLRMDKKIPGDLADMPLVGHDQTK